MPKQPVFGNILRAARTAQGITQSELSSRSGIALRHIQQLEQNQSNPSYRTILMVTAGLGAQLVIGFRTADEEPVV